MNLGQLRARFRQRADDLAAPFLWADDEINGYINEAESEAADRAWLLFDDTTADETAITTQAGVASYALHPSVIEIDRITRDDSGYVVRQTDIDALDARNYRWREYEGDPLEYVLRGHNILLYPKPTQALTLRLDVYRLPVTPMVADDDEPEIPARHHERLIDWVLYRAYSKRDADTDDRSRAGDHKALFIESFGIREDANVQRKQREGRKPVVRNNPEWGSGPRQNNFPHRSRRYGYDGSC